MRYAYLISHKMALFDLPSKKYGQITSDKDSLFERFAKRLLVFDSVPDDDYSECASEASYSLSQPDPGFAALPRGELEEFMRYDGKLYKWNKVKKDHNYLIRSETKARNASSPYFNSNPANLESWDDLPNFSRQKRNQPWQFDALYTDAQYFAAEAGSLTKNYKSSGDKDVFRAKINSLLVPDRLVFAINSAESRHDFMEREASLVDAKLSLDGYKLAQLFLNRSIESLYKMQWNYSDSSERIAALISSAEKLLSKIINRAGELERRFILYYTSISEEEQ